MIPGKEIIKSLGVVFGDIGTSPIYTMSVIFAVIPVSPANIFGVLSLVIWTLIILVFVQYAWLAMSLSNKGEGGTIVLKEILTPLVSSPAQVALVTLLSFIGISFLIGDGVITPAISILSAVEGLHLIPAFKLLGTPFLVIFACIIAIGLFTFQKKGTETVSIAFGPLMLIWFCILGFFGLVWLIKAPQVFKAINPLYGISFLLTNKLAGFIMLSKVMLCATGGEALYADMGHLGRKPILRAWLFVFVMLIINYMGQAAFLLVQPNAHQHIFYDMLLQYAPYWYIPLVVLSISATVVASQAMISGVFSVIYQGITTNIIPRFKIDYTSRKLRSQIYIPFINWFLFLCSLLAIIGFQESYNVAAAYGLAASCTMTITALMMTWIFLRKNNLVKSIVASLILGINIIFLLANTSKIPYGGYWSLIIAMLPLTAFIIYTTGRKRFEKSWRPLAMPRFLDIYNETRAHIAHIEGSAVFLAKNVKKLPPYIGHIMFINTIMYEENIIVSVVTKEQPFGVTASFKEDLAPGLRVFVIYVGYMEIVDIEKILKKAHIDPKVIFYGVEDISTKNIIWRIFALIKKLTPSFVQFYKLPFQKLHGVVMQVEI